MIPLFILTVMGLIGSVNCNYEGVLMYKLKKRVTGRRLGAVKMGEHIASKVRSVMVRRGVVNYFDCGRMGRVCFCGVVDGLHDRLPMITFCLQGIEGQGAFGDVDCPNYPWGACEHSP